MKIIVLSGQLFFKSLYEYLINLPNYLEIEVNQQKYVLVHAGIDVRYPTKRTKIKFSFMDSR